MDTYTLMLADIIEKTKIDRDNIALVRHTRSNEFFAEVWKEGIEFFEEYQKIQPENYFHGKNFIFSFIGEQGTTARFIGVYKVKSIIALKDAVIDAEYWKKYAGKHNKEADSYFDLEKLDLLEDLQNRLVIDYCATRNIVNVNWKTIAKKPVISISSRRFEGYENILWTYSDLEHYINHAEIYDNYYFALSSVNGVYLIVDTKDHKQYVGSASGDEGIWGRWKEYVKTSGTGGNKKLGQHLGQEQNQYRNLQYTILEVIPKTGNKDKDRLFVLGREMLYKKKLQTRNDETGLNCN